MSRGFSGFVAGKMNKEWNKTKNKNFETSGVHIRTTGVHAKTEYIPQHFESQGNGLKSKMTACPLS